MLLRRLVLVIAVTAIFTITVRDLTSATTPDDSVQVGATILHAEPITGVWETNTSSGKVLGLSIAMNTTVAGLGATIRGLKQRVRFIRIITYLRGATGFNQTLLPGAPSKEQTFWDTDLPGKFHWQHDHLQLHDTGSRYGSPNVDLDLVFDPKASRWTGTLKRADFSGQVTMTRPSNTIPTAPTGFWRQMPAQKDSAFCLHIAIGNDSRFVLWADYVFVDYGNGRQPPEQTAETHGELLRDPTEKRIDRQWQFDLSNGIWGEHIAGVLNDDNTIFSGDLVHYGNGIYAPGQRYPFEWQRIAGDSCSSA